MENNETQAKEEAIKTSQETSEQPKESLSIIEEAEALRDDIRKERETIQEERAKIEKLRAERILGGRAGGAVQPEPVKADSPEEYAAKLERGEVDPLKDDGII